MNGAVITPVLFRGSEGSDPPLLPDRAVAQLAPFHSLGTTGMDGLQLNPWDGAARLVWRGDLADNEVLLPVPGYDGGPLCLQQLLRMDGIHGLSSGVGHRLTS